ncbi:MAG: HAMP domain-containing histidine kinase [Anaerolineae bacterium]|nr:HAMP domain-containing histidine kinase [Anaerolineae bacterium]
MIALNYRLLDDPDSVYFNPFLPQRPTDNNGAVMTWSGSIELFDSGVNNDYAPVRPDTFQESTDFVLAVAGTPYGFGLGRDSMPGRRSDQHVKTALIDRENNLVGYVELSEGPAYGSEIVDGVARALLIAAGVAVLVAAGIGWIISQRISAPLILLSQATRRMAEGNLSARVSMTRQDEFGLLAQSFNEMASRVENTITTLKRFVADAAHELHTPLTAVYANLELAASEGDDERRISFLEQAQLQLKRLEALTTNLLMLSRLEAGTAPDERATTNLAELMRETSELYASRAEQKGIVFELDVPDCDIRLRANENQLRRVIGNLLDNAIKFTPENGTIRVGIYQQGQDVRILVKDTGIGISEEDLPYLFGRFRRGRNAASYPGSGLGLAIIKAIVEAHSGKVSVESGPEGTQFALLIPATI